MRKRLILALGGVLLIAGFVVDAPPDTGVAEFVSKTRWQEDHEKFGGLSGMEIGADGADLIVISDRGKIFTAGISRTDGVVTDITVRSDLIMLNPSATRLTRKQRDPEGLAIGEDGAIYVSYENDTRIWQFSTLSTAPTPMPDHPAFEDMPKNGGLEALAIDAGGALYTLPEIGESRTGLIPVYRFKDGTWDQPFALTRRGPYLPVGADFGPDGKLYLLERHFTGFTGFRTRVRRFDVAEGAVKNEQVLLTTSAGRHDNLEGLGVWRDDTGTIRLTMVSDDNFMMFQQTELVEYRIP